jgi:hypothetical protein
MRILRALAVIAALTCPAHAGPYVTASSGNVANATATATLAATTGMQWSVTGLEITAGGCTAATMVSASVTGLYGGTVTYAFGCPLGAAVPAVPLVVNFNPPLDAAAVGGAIVLTLPALGSGNTNAAVAIHGYLR